MVSSKQSSSPASSPVIVAGMHRSGTSLVASFLSALGLDLGGDLVPADDNNPRGYYEDPDFLELSRSMLVAATREGDGGHRDWGWTESEHLDLAGVDRAEACRALVAERQGKGVAWGWKDPRTTLLLDFWDEASDGEARFVLLYRYPWDVADSMQRLGADVFLDHPDYAYKIWDFYNQCLLDFYRRHESRAVLASVNALIRNPERFVALLDDKLGLETGAAAWDELFDGDHYFHTIEGSDPLIDLAAIAHPRTVALLQDLDRAADLSGTQGWQVGAVGAGKKTTTREVDLSIVIPCYNHGELLLEAVASVERGAPHACELLIVNDGSQQPHTLAILAALREAGYRILDQDNQGLSAARNHGIEEARGRYIFPLDADNRVRPGFLGKAIEILDARREIGVVFGDRWLFGLEQGRLEVPEVDLEKLLWRNTLDACAVYRKSLWADVGGYDTDLRAWEDWEFWIHASIREWRFHHLGEIAFDYRVRPGSLATLLVDREILEQTVGRVVSKHREVYRKRLHTMLGVVEAWPGWLERVRDQEWQQKCALEEKNARYERLIDDLTVAREDAEKALAASETERLRIAREKDEIEADHDRLWERKCELEDENGRLWREKCALEEAVADLQRRLARSESEREALEERSRGPLAGVVSRLKWKG